MTDRRQRGGTPGEPPLSVDTLANLHAGVPPDAIAAQLWPRVQADPQAGAVLAALDATRADLAGLAQAPAPRMPKKIAARLDAAIAEESARRAGIAPVVDIQAARERRKISRKLGWTAGLIAAAAALIGAAIVVLPGSGGSPGRGVAAPPPGSSPSTTVPALSRGQLGSVALADALHKSNYGPLSDASRLRGCLSANGLDPNQKPIGATQITLDGKPGTLLILTTGQLAQYRLVVVGPTCSAGHPATMANQVIGGISQLPVPPPTR